MEINDRDKRSLLAFPQGSLMPEAYRIAIRLMIEQQL
jgi:hypothetical protein